MNFFQISLYSFLAGAWFIYQVLETVSLVMDVKTIYNLLTLESTQVEALCIARLNIYKIS